MTEDDPVAAFRIEAEDLLEQIEGGLLDLGQNLADQALVNTVFRGLHTLKGSGAMFGFDDLAAFTHHCESAFDRIRKGHAAATPELVSVILAAKDHMRALLAGIGSRADDGAAILERLRQVVTAGEPAVAAADPPAQALPTADAPSAAAGWRLHFQLPAAALANGTNPLALLAELRSLGASEVRCHVDRIPPLEVLDPAECHLHWDLVLPAGVTREDIEDVFIFVLDGMTMTLEPLATGEPAGTAPAPDAGVPAPAAGTAAEAVAAPAAADGSAKPAETVRVPAERLDELMNRVGELVIAQSRLTQLAQHHGAIDAAMLRSIAEDIERLSSELRDTTMVMRMMQVGSLFGRFRRLVHDLARETGKAITFVAEGGTTEVDKTVIERLADPLVHLIRNSCDHGLETPPQRLEAGKPATGSITISAEQAGGEVIITVADDGRGIDRAAVRAKAIANGLIGENDVLPDQELLQLIFHPGFSTAAQVTNLSGRGVGMDVVKKTIEGLRGTIALETAAGTGTRIRLHLPLTLAIIECMFVRVGGARYAIPLSAVEECLELPAGEAEGRGGRSFLDVRGDLVPYVRMRELFRTEHPVELHPKIVIVGSGEARVGLVVDQIIGNAQTVIKPLARHHAAIGTFSGATILGDGTVALIVDVGNLLATAQRQPRHGASLGEAA